MQTQITPQQLAAPAYPKIRRLKDGSPRGYGVPSNAQLLVLFTSITEGTIIHSEVSRPAGTHDRSWSAGEFEDYNGVVTLRN